MQHTRRGSRPAAVARLAHGAYKSCRTNENLNVQLTRRGILWQLVIADRTQEVGGALPCSRRAMHSKHICALHRERTGRVRARQQGGVPPNCVACNARSTHPCRARAP